MTKVTWEKSFVVFMHMDFQQTAQVFPISLLTVRGTMRLRLRLALFSLALSFLMYI